MILIDEYIKLSKQDRQKHLKLDEPCVNRGTTTNGVSYYCKGLLAHVLDTSIPFGRKIQLCHACHNSNCSNPNHLYWGTASENSIDRMNNGDKNVWEKMVNKYGLEEARKMQGIVGNTNGAGNKDKSKTDSHKEKISKSVQKNYDNGLVVNTGRKAINTKDELVELVDKFGLKGAAEKLNISLDALKGRYYRVKKSQ